MTIYNSTIKIDRDCAAGWMAWQKEHQIPGIMATGLFFSQETFRLLDQDDSDGYTYILQFRAEKPEQLHAFLQDHRSYFDQAADKKWGGRFVSFQSTMELVQ
jgi:hypothetical protein